MQLHLPIVTPKAWGEEIEIINNELYCAKILRFRPFGKFSCHFHAKKHEGWYFLHPVEVRWVDTSTATKHSLMAKAGDCLVVNRLVPHQIYNYNDFWAEVYEVSTHHEDTDSYRIEPGDSQKTLDKSPKSV